MFREASRGLNRRKLQRGPETISRRPITTSLRMRRDRDAEGVERRGEGCPLTIRLGVWGSVVNSPSGIRGGAPAENGFYAFETRKKPPGTPFSVSLCDGGAPKTSRGPGKLPLSSPLDGPARGFQYRFLYLNVLGGRTILEA